MCSPRCSRRAKGREEIRYRRRPGGHGRTVRGPITFDEPLGTAVLDLREGEVCTGVEPGEVRPTVTVWSRRAFVSAGSR